MSRSCKEEINLQASSWGRDRWQMWLTSAQRTHRRGSRCELAGRVLPDCNLASYKLTRPQQSASDRDRAAQVWRWLKDSLPTACDFLWRFLSKYDHMGSTALLKHRITRTLKQRSKNKTSLSGKTDTPTFKHIWHYLMWSYILHLLEMRLFSNSDSQHRTHLFNDCMCWVSRLTPNTPKMLITALTPKRAH